MKPGWIERQCGGDRAGAFLQLFSLKHQCERFGAALRTAEAEPDGSLNPEAVMGCIDSRTRMLAITAMSNVTGFRPQLRRIIEEAHRAGARVFVDASQEAAHHPINVQEMDCDLLCFSGTRFTDPWEQGCSAENGSCLRKCARISTEGAW